MNMEAIRTYIENVFKAFDESEKVAVLKRDMLSGMEEKYNALKDEGKSEHEAVGSVIADFGSIDEIAAEIGIQRKPGESASAGDGGEEDYENVIPLTRDEAYDVINRFKKSSIGIGAGVWIVLTGVALFMLISNTELANAEGFGLFALLSFVAGAVPFFIVHGMALSRFEEYDGKRLELDTSTRAEIKLAQKNYVPKFSGLIATGVVIVLMALGLFLLMGADSEESRGLSVALLLFIIGGATMLFINAGMTFSVYFFLLGEGDYKYPARGNKAAVDYERVIGTVAAVFWPTITAAYLLWSFIGDSWHISWVIWPVAGVLFGAFAGGLSTWYEGKK
jgi:hypothetical protein